MERVTGLGGVFFKSQNPAGVLDWYRTHLGIDSTERWGFAFQWRERDRPEEVGYTVWGAFSEETEYFAPSQLPFMLNFRVADLEALMEELRAAGCRVVGEIEEHENGKFAWVLDPEDRKIELWEPVPSAVDPTLQ